MHNLMPRIGTADHLFKDGNPAAGEAGTIVTAQWLNKVQEHTRAVESELNNVLASVGMTADPNNSKQLVGALGLSYSPTTKYHAGRIVWAPDDDSVPHIGNYYESYHPDGCLGKDPRDPVNRPDGWTNTDPAAPYYWLKHGKWIELATIGAAVPIQRTTVSSQLYIKYRNDGNLHKDKFWRLAQVYPDLISGNIITIADLRGEFIRGLDDGRGVDAGRTVGSGQGDAIRNITGRSGNLIKGVHGSDAGAVVSVDGQPTPAGIAGGSLWRERYNTFDASRVVPTSHENRPRNIALLYQVRF